MKFFILCFFLIFSSNSHSYNRKSWRHWIDTDRDCQNTRAEILISNSLRQVTFKETKRKRKDCIVKTGQWNDFYYPEVLYLAKNIDIDHIVPLKYASIAGGEGWSKEKKKKFANDPLNLVVTNKRYNRQKGAKGILQWMPIHKRYACRYIKRWMLVKKKYGLKISNEEIDYSNQMNCLDGK